jgi:colanic acid biosynthesis glycosyl transferase WcaI
MKLLIFGLNFAPELIGVGKYTGEMAAWLARRGHEVSIITTRPYYPEWRRTSGLKRFLWTSETWQGCQVLRCPLYVPKRVTGPRRILHLGSFAAASIPAAIRRLLDRKPDIVVAIAPALTVAPVALSLARSMGSKTWLHFQDLEIDAAFELGVIQRRGIAGWAMKMERRIVTSFDLVSAISPKMLDAVSAKGVAPEKLALFPNWVDMQRIKPLANSARLRREFGIGENQCVILYSGSMGRKQGLDSVIAAARRLDTEATSNVIILLVGTGPERAALELSAKGLRNVKFFPLQPEERLNELLNLADIHLLPQKLAATDLVMPSKLGGILAAGKPVIATVEPNSQIALTIDTAGIITPPEDATALADAIHLLVSDPERRRRMSEAALDIARTSFEAERILRGMEARLADLAGK